MSIWNEEVSKYAVSQADIGIANMIGHAPPTPRQRLEWELKELHKRIETITLLLKNFDENPGLEEALNLMRKLGV